MTRAGAGAVAERRAALRTLVTCARAVPRGVSISMRSIRGSIVASLWVTTAHSPTRPRRLRIQARIWVTTALSTQWLRRVWRCDPPAPVPSDHPGRAYPVRRHRGDVHDGDVRARETARRVRSRVRVRLRAVQRLRVPCGDLAVRRRRGDLGGGGGPSLRGSSPARRTRGPAAPYQPRTRPPAECMVSSTPRASMRLRGLEPPRPEEHRHLKPARLPIPPQPREART